VGQYGKDLWGTENQVASDCTEYLQHAHSYILVGFAADVVYNALGFICSKFVLYILFINNFLWKELHRRSLELPFYENLATEAQHSNLSLNSGWCYTNEYKASKLTL